MAEYAKPSRARQHPEDRQEQSGSAPGVKAVVTWEDIPDWRGGTPRIVRVLDKKVRYMGDAVALVAATSERIAEEALGLIEVDYEVLPAVFDIDSALKPDAPLLYEELRKISFPEAHPFTGLIACKASCAEMLIRDLRKPTSSRKAPSIRKHAQFSSCRSPGLRRDLGAAQ